MKDKILNLLLCCLVFSASCLLTYGLLKQPEPPTFNVAEDYEDQFAATCAVVVSADVMFKGGGTGVLLSNGNILTAKHVADNNRNGLIDASERRVRIKFYYPKVIICSGRVIYTPQERLRIARGYDFIVVRPDIDIRSNIRLASIEEHVMTGAGEEIYTIGRKDSYKPHIFFGNQSTKIDDSDNLYDRMHLPIWYGNSGGGIFRKSDGLLLGIVIIKKSAETGPRWYRPDMWSGYMSASNIRFYLMHDGAEHFIQRIQDTRAYKLQSFILYSLIILNCFLGVYFGLPILCKKMWSLRRTNAVV
jgi:hypothetical protein